MNICTGCNADYGHCVCDEIAAPEGTEEAGAVSMSPSTSLLASLRSWMPHCLFCNRLATRQQTWSDRGPLYFCDSDTCAAEARDCFDGDHDYDRYGLEVCAVAWAETARLVEANSLLGGLGRGNKGG